MRLAIARSSSFCSSLQESGRRPWHTHSANVGIFAVWAFHNPAHAPIDAARAHAVHWTPPEAAVDSSTMQDAQRLSGYFEASLPPVEQAHSLELKRNLGPWPVIWAIGGAVWAGVTCVALVWLLPWSGTWLKSGYVLSTAGSAAKDLGVFLMAAVAYRAAIAIGWPSTLARRALVLCLNAVFVLSVLVWSEMLDAVFTGLIDHQYADMHRKFHTVFGLFGRLDWFVALLRSYFIPYALGLCAVVLALVVNRRHQDALRTAELARAYAAARMALLSAQLQPHFLFNSLNALTELIEENPRQASAMVVRLGNFLRHVLESSHTPWVTVSTEIEGLETYLDIQRVRFANKVAINIDVSPSVLDLRVPSLILQPLVENAIEHGRRASGPGALAINIELRSRGEHLHVTIRNSRPQLPAKLVPQDYGRGLSNVYLRLRAAYSEAAHLAIEPGAAGGTVVTLVLPRKSAKEPDWELLNL
jgi:hypothetical protein